MVGFSIAAGFLSGALVAGLAFGFFHLRQMRKCNASWDSRIDELRRLLKTQDTLDADLQLDLAKAENRSVEADIRAQAMACGIQDLRRALEEARNCAQLCRDRANRAESESQELKARLAVTLIALRKAERDLESSGRKISLREQAAAGSA